MTNRLDDARRRSAVIASVIEGATGWTLENGYHNIINEVFHHTVRITPSVIERAE